jgi:hypothetical protein
VPIEIWARGLADDPWAAGRFNRNPSSVNITLDPGY